MVQFQVGELKGENLIKSICPATAKVVKKVDITTVYYDIEFDKHKPAHGGFTCIEGTRYFECQNCGALILASAE